MTRPTPFVEARAGVLAAPLSERDARAPAAAPAGTPWGRLACRDLGRYYAALHELQQRLPVTELELTVIGHALREAPGPSGRVAVDGSDLCVLWHTVERACRGGLAGRHDVDAARLVTKLRVLPLFQLAAIVDLAERSAARPFPLAAALPSRGA